MIELNITSLSLRERDRVRVGFDLASILDVCLLPVSNSNHDGAMDVCSTPLCKISTLVNTYP